jgi:Fur family peroxide stress response transcriptional regulator
MEDYIIMVNLKKFLEEKKISPTIQRLKILKFIKGNKKHPTVDMIYRKISKEIPSLSKTTIYNTMNLLVKKGVVSEICLGEGELRYDINLKPHGHFRCTECGKIFDVELKSKLFEMKRIDGNQISHTSIYFTGKCEECLKLR